MKYDLVFGDDGKSASIDVNIPKEDFELSKEEFEILRQEARWCYSSLLSNDKEKYGMELENDKEKYGMELENDKEKYGMELENDKEKYGMELDSKVKQTEFRCNAIITGINGAVLNTLGVIKEMMVKK